jgi:hypothetical protein
MRELRVVQTSQELPLKGKEPPLMKRPRSFLCRCSVIAFGCLALLLTFSSTSASARTRGSTHLTTVAQSGRHVSTTVSPLTASGCNQSVCIDIVGSGRYVSFINVYLEDGIAPPGGGTGVILFKGSTDWPGGVFAFLPGTYGINVNYDEDFPSTGQVCGEIVGFRGKPCEEIE